MYKIEIIINTDGDFDYKNSDIEEEFVKNDFYSALLRTMGRLDEIYDTLEGRDWVVENVRGKLSSIMEDLKYAKDEYVQSDDFDCGNQDGEVKIHRISRQENDAIIQIRNATRNWN